MAESVENRIDLGKAIKMRFLNGNTLPEIAEYFKVSKQAAHQALAPFKDIIQDQNILTTYQENYSNILRNANMQLMQAMHDPDKIAGASLNNVAYAFNTVANHLRLEENKSTDNVGFKGMIDHIKKSADNLDTMQDALAEQLFAD
jgi:predicted DNA-binding protein YlxM (UPF0122 family)